MPVRPDLDTLERLLAEATPGPWSAGYGHDEPDLTIWASGHCLFADSFRYARSSDAALIVAAVNALPALLADARKVETLERLLKDLTPTPDGGYGPSNGAAWKDAYLARLHEVNVARAQVETLQGVVNDLLQMLDGAGMKALVRKYRAALEGASDEN